MTNFSHGRAAETAAANYITRQGYAILHQNWRRRSCEIDVVAKRSNCIYFVEVKYRLNRSQGDGLDYITPTKLKQMNYAGQMWLSENNWDGDYCLSAIEVTGEQFEVSEFISSVT